MDHDHGIAMGTISSWVWGFGFEDGDGFGITRMGGT